MRLTKLSNQDQIITALAIDQRGAIEKLIPNLEGEERTRLIKDYKSAVSAELTKYASSILLDPVYGLEAIDHIHKDAGLILAYEVTGYRDDRRRLDLTEDLSVQRIKEMGADTVKILLYYDVDGSQNIHQLKKICSEINSLGQKYPH